MSQFPEDRTYVSPFAGVTGLDLLEKDKQERRQRELGRKIYKEFERIMRAESAEEKAPARTTPDVIKQAIEAGKRKLNAGWCVETDPEKPEDFTVSEVSLTETKEEVKVRGESDEEKYDRVMASLLENPLK